MSRSQALSAVMWIFHITADSFRYERMLNKMSETIMPAAQIPKMVIMNLPWYLGLVK